MQTLGYLSKAKEHIEEVRGKKLSVDQRREAAIELAALILHEARLTQTPDEVIHLSQLSRMMADATGKAFTTAMTDQCFRSSSYARAADQLAFNLRKFGIPKYFNWDKRAALFAFRLLGKTMPGSFIPLTRKMIRKETGKVILPGESEKLIKHLHSRYKEHVRVNLNHLGEAILGEDEAKSRLQVYLEDLAKPEIEYISIKISTIYSQINLLAREHTLEVLKERLRILYRKAKQHRYKTVKGREVYKFVNLDMEEYRDLHLTVDLFIEVLSEQEFQDLSAGIVLQSYLPDSYELQQKLTQWGIKRVAEGGAPIKIRIVKGANLAMEQVEASLKGWPQAPYAFKSDTDANFKRMVHYGFKPEHAKAANLGIGSHNLFDIAYALLLREENGIAPYVCFEMLEGMADPIRRAVQHLAGDMLVYCPVASEEEFQYALAYLMRRLDENTAPENFLRYAFNMVPGSKEWQGQATLFSIACENIDNVRSTPRKRQNRLAKTDKNTGCLSFENESDTDWSVQQNCAWGNDILKAWAGKTLGSIPLVIGGQEIAGAQGQGNGVDPSYPDRILYHYALADESQAKEAIKTACEIHTAWKNKSVEERSNLLCEAAHVLRAKRGDLIGSMVAGTGKTVYEADAEVSEAIDFAEYYARNLEELHCFQDILWESKGAVLVAPPWNFPCSIPAGSIFGALAGGNTVIFKPAPEAVLVGWQLAQALWEAGIGKDVLQFITCEDDPVGTLLIQDPRIAAVVLTGATETARRFLKIRPGLDLIAETGGKNAIIITAMSDRDLAVRDLIQSAFGHAGQKCSACSLAICEAEVYDDTQFMKSLRDAASSLIVGSPWDPSVKVNPLIHAPNLRLAKGLTELEEGEEWLLTPKQDEKNPHLWSPGIKLGVKAGSFTHQTEFFGPLLGIMRADSLQHALDLANGTPYGLTSGLHSLDEREQRYWAERIEAGNCYINRGITGAIVQRQPFGGCKASSFGQGLKAGGPNYVMQFMRAVQIKHPVEMDSVEGPIGQLTTFVESLNLGTEAVSLWHASVGSYAFYWNHYFKEEHDPTKLIGQDNFLKYVQLRQLTVRIHPGDTLFDIMRVIAAGATVGATVEISGKPEQLNLLLQTEWRKQFPKILFVPEVDEALAARIKNGEVKRLRCLAEAGEAIKQAAAEEGCSLVIAPVLANGRLELLQYLREVSLSVDYHRYGYLGLREGEKRKPLPDPETTKAANPCSPQCCMTEVCT